MGRYNLLFIGILCSANLAYAAECAIDIYGTETKDYTDTAGKKISQIVIPAACNEFAVTLTNTSKRHKTTMGHNFVVAKQGDVKGIVLDGAIAGIKKDYLKPKDKRVLVHTKLLGPGESDTVKIKVASIKGGGYDFFCSFLGHETKMHGKLIVQ